MQHKVNMQVENDEGKTGLDMAREYKRTELIEKVKEIFKTNIQENLKDWDVFIIDTIVDLLV